MSPFYHSDYISIGANRSCSVCSADPATGVIAYGAGKVVGFWDPVESDKRLVKRTLPGHTAPITTLKHFPSFPPYASSSSAASSSTLRPTATPFISGDNQGHVAFWLPSTSSDNDATLYTPAKSSKAHEGSVSALATYTSPSPDNQNPGDKPDKSEGIFLTGGTDNVIKVFSWRIGDNEGEEHDKVVVEEVQTIKLGGKIPLDMVVSRLPGSNALILALALTDRKIRLYTSPSPSSPSSSSSINFQPSISLEGHEDWVRCLDFSPYQSLHTTGKQDGKQEGHGAGEGDLMLASGSQDGYVRLWRVSALAAALQQAESSGDKNGLGEGAGGADELDDDMLDEFERRINGEAGGSRQLSTREHVIAVERTEGSNQYSISLEALLIGHESKLTNLHFSPSSLSHIYPTPQLLSTANDNSMIIWAPESAPAVGGQQDGHGSGSGNAELNSVWVPKHRFGELGAGRSLGLFGAVWAVGAGGEDVSVIANGWNGGFYRWRRTLEGDSGEEDWEPALAPTGHLIAVKDIAWDPQSEFLISVGTDQTTRVHAPCRSPSNSPNDPPVWGELGRPQIHGYDMTCVAFLDRLRIASGADEKVVRAFDAPKGFAASLYGLGVTENDMTASTSAVGASVPPLGLSNRALNQAVDSSTVLEEKGFNQEHISISDEMRSLPIESVLSSATLWPEIEKLYGHGYELITIAASPDGSLLATACKATTAEHAVVRIYDTKTWKQVGKPLVGHTLTIARIRFSADGRYILTCSRDRTWRLFRRVEGSQDFEPIAADRSHARIVWDCAFAPGGEYFVTVSRDKQIKFWVQDGGDTKWKAASTVKGKDGVTAVDVIRDKDRDLVAVGYENGGIEIFDFKGSGNDVASVLRFDESDCHVDQVQRVAWRRNGSLLQLASCSEDASVRVTTLNL